MVIGVFSNSKDAGTAVAELKNKGYTNDISVITRSSEGGMEEEKIKSDGDIAAETVTGAGAGALAGLVVGLSTIVVPGLGSLVVGGPLLATWGITGAALGAFAGSITGAFVDIGVPENVAEMYEQKIRSGATVVAVTTDSGRQGAAEEIIKSYNAEEITLTDNA